MLDKTDLDILRSLQAHGRKKRNELAEEVGLSIPSVSERLRKLEEQGIISQYTTVLDHKQLGYDVTAFVVVSVDTSKHYEDFLRHVDDNPEILECHAITGEGSHLLKVRSTSTASLESILSVIQSWRGVMGTRTSVVLSTRKETLTIPLTDPSPSKR